MNLSVNHNSDRNKSTKSALTTLVAIGVTTSVLGGLVLTAPAATGATGAPSPNSGVSAETPRTPFTKKSVTVGYSKQGRKITALRQGPATAPYVLLVLGQMHGNEPKGKLVVKALRKLAISNTSQVQIWSISTLNPDGSARFTRQNARKVDLNRNFPKGWKKSRKGTFYSGKSAASERETKATMRFINQLKPNATLSFHQHANTVFSMCSKTSRAWVQLTGKLMKLPLDRPTKSYCKTDSATYSGTLNEWVVDQQNYGVFATIELPPSSRVTTARVKRYAKATRRLALEVPRFV